MLEKNEIRNIISGNAKVSHGETIQAITSYLRGKKAADSKFKEYQQQKQKEEQDLRAYSERNNIWIYPPDESKYLAEGAEQRIYADEDPAYVVKTNSGIFYAFWEDYFNNLLLHNFFFPHLAYQFLGFIKKDNVLEAVVRQPFVRTDEATDLDKVSTFLEANGFIRKKENDYYHPNLCLILEDLHDENVLTKEGTLQFVDTVFYLMPNFYLE